MNAGKQVLQCFPSHAGRFLPASASAAAQRRQQWHDSALLVQSCWKVQCLCLQLDMHPQGTSIIMLLQYSTVRWHGALETLHWHAAVTSCIDTLY